MNGDHLYYSPIDARSRTTEMNSDSWGIPDDEPWSRARQGITLTEVVGKQRYALWIPRSPLHSRETSGIERPIIGSNSWQAHVNVADGKDHLMGTSVLSTNGFRKEPVIRWLISSITGDTKYDSLKAPVPDFVEFTVLSAEVPAQGDAKAICPNPPGKLLTQGMVSVGEGSTISIGLDWGSPEPRVKVKSSESSPKDSQPGSIFNGQTTLVTTFCGLKAELTIGKWTATYRPDPVITVDTLDYDGDVWIPPGAKKPIIPISCERALYEEPSTANGTLPAPGKQISVSLGAGRVLIVRRLAP